jgi:hypothetical protein
MIDHRNLIKERQEIKANKLKKALINEGFFASNPYTSITNFGVSTYIHFDDKFNVHRKFRISDHSVSNYDRIFGEYHYTENTDVNSLVHIVKKDIEETEQNVIEREKIHSADADRTILADDNWEKIKKRFNGLCFKKNERTYQVLNEFSKNKNRTNIYQKIIGKNRFGEDAFYYEWTEPKNPNEICKDKPSREFIENYIFKYDNGGNIIKFEYSIGGL